MDIRASWRRGTSAGFEGSKDLGRRSRVCQVGTPRGEAQSGNGNLRGVSGTLGELPAGALSGNAKLMDTFPSFGVISSSHVYIPSPYITGVEKCTSNE